MFSMKQIIYCHCYLRPLPFSAHRRGRNWQRINCVIHLQLFCHFYKGCLDMSEMRTFALSKTIMRKGRQKKGRSLKPYLLPWFLFRKTFIHRARGAQVGKLWFGGMDQESLLNFRNSKLPNERVWNCKSIDRRTKECREKLGKWSLLLAWKGIC